MDYFISYKGKRLGPGMNKEEAEAAYTRLSRSFAGLEIVKDIPLADHPSSCREVSKGKSALTCGSSDQCQR